MTLKLLAIEFTGEFVHILHLNAKNGNMLVEKTVHVKMPANCYVNGMVINNDRSVSELILNTLRDEKIREKKTIVSVSGSDCLTEEFSLPKDKPKILDGMVEQELLKRRKLNASYIYDYSTLGDDPLNAGYVKIKVVLCPKSLINNYYDVLKKAQLEPFKFDLISHSMEFLAQKSALSSSSEISVLACINQDELHFVYCGRNEEPYYRRASINKEDMLDESMFVLSATNKFNLGLDSAQNLQETVIENITKLTRFHSQRHPEFGINAIYLYGDYEDIPTLCDRIYNAVGIVTRSYSPVASIGHLTMHHREILSGSINVLGTALGFFDQKAKTYEFFEKFENAKKEKGSNIFWLPTMVSILAIALVVVFYQVFGVKNKQLKEQIDTQQDYVINQYNVEAYEMTQEMIGEIELRYQYNEKTLDYIQEFEHANRLGSEEFELIDSLLTDDIAIGGMQFDNGRITLNCTGTDQYSPSNFTKTLSDRPEFENVTYTGFVASMSPDGDYVYSFTVVMDLSQEGGN